MDNEISTGKFFDELFSALNNDPKIQQIKKDCDNITQTYSKLKPEPKNMKQEELPVQNNDPVNHPTHYNYGKIEVIEYIEDKGFDYLIGNAIKYLSRAGHKNDEIEDLEKAIWYINRKIQKLKEERK